jgi:hypothetical protein
MSCPKPEVSQRCVFFIFGRWVWDVFWFYLGVSDA